MSSHHIVRAKQEPALLILHPGFDPELLGQLLEWSPTVIVAAPVYEAIASLGIKIDVVAGAVEATQGDLRQIDAPDGYLLAALTYLIAEGYPAVNIINDQVLPLSFAHNAAMTIVWFCRHEKTSYIKSGFRLWKPAGTLFKVNDTTGVSMLNLAEEGDDTYKVLEDGFISFNFNQPLLLLTEKL